MSASSGILRKGIVYPTTLHNHLSQQNGAIHIINSFLGFVMPRQRTLTASPTKTKTTPFTKSTDHLFLLCLHILPNAALDTRAIVHHQCYILIPCKICLTAPSNDQESLSTYYCMIEFTQELRVLLSRNQTKNNPLYDTRP